MRWNQDIYDVICKYNTLLLSEIRLRKINMNICEDAKNKYYTSENVMTIYTKSRRWDKSPISSCKLSRFLASAEVWMLESQI